MIRDVLKMTDALEAEMAALEGDTAPQALLRRKQLLRDRTELLDSCTNLSAEDKVFLARHPHRPKIDDYINALFTDFFEQKGDRQCREDASILGGVAFFHGMPVTVIGHRKGNNLEENMKYNFGMPGPEGYRKALRLMKQAETFGRPVICFVDTPGAFCGLEAEERGQGEAIARNLFEMAALTVPVVSLVIGEGGSGGALALAVADRVWMLQNALYSVISPEGCASILWKDSSKAETAAAYLKMTAEDAKALGIIEKILSERDIGKKEFYDRIRALLTDQLAELSQDPDLVGKRYDRFRRIGTAAVIKE